MSIENPTLAHFRHFSSLLTNEYPVSSIQYRLSRRSLWRSREYRSHKKTFLCKTNPIYPDFAPKTRILPKNKANSNPIKANSNPIQSQFKPNQTQPVVSLPALPALSLSKGARSKCRTYFNPNMPKTNPNKPNFKPVPRCSSSILIFNFLFSFYGLSHSPSSVKKSLKRLTVKQLWAGRTIKTSPILILSKYLLSTFTTPCA